MAPAKKAKRKTPAKRRTPAVPPVLTQSAQPARPLFRLLPATILTASLLLTMKVIEVVQQGQELSQELFYNTAVAEPSKAEEKPKEVKAEEKKEETTEEAPAEEAPAEEGGEHGAKKEEPLPPGASKEAPKPTPKGEGLDVPAAQQNYNKREVDVLESLAARREKLDQMERDVDLRAKVLEATEQRIDAKIAELNSLSKEVKGMIVVHDKEEESKIASLVKVYEAMKPKDAARIFDEMDMNVLLLVIDRMNERRIAPVLAAMSPEKAKDVTQQLAAQQKTNKQTLDAADQVEGPPL